MTFHCPTHGEVSDEEILALTGSLSTLIALVTDGECSRSVAFALLISIMALEAQQHEAAIECNDLTFEMPVDAPLLAEARRLGNLYLAQVQRSMRRNQPHQ